MGKLEVESSLNISEAAKPQSLTPNLAWSFHYVLSLLPTYKPHKLYLDCFCEININILEF